MWHVQSAMDWWEDDELHAVRPLSPFAIRFGWESDLLHFPPSRGRTLQGPSHRTCAGASNRSEVAGDNKVGSSSSTLDMRSGVDKLAWSSHACVWNDVRVTATSETWDQPTFPGVWPAMLRGASGRTCAAVLLADDNIPGTLSSGQW